MKNGSVCARQGTEHPIPLSTISPRPLRADARRNREKVLAAAADAFAEAGLDAQVEDIARRASVGVGTLYRHFPTKEALFDGLARAHFAQLTEIIEATKPGADPWAALQAAIWRCAEAIAGNVALCEVIAGHPAAIAAAAEGQQRLEAATARLIDGARAQGAIREDATVQDVRTIMCGFGHVAAAQRAGGRLDWQRYLTIALDGLRAR
jgi:AcrR family transcriptional regulator